MRDVNRPAEPVHAVTVWYDSECPLCAREIALMRRLDRDESIRFEEIQGTTDCPLDRQTLLARFHAQERGAEIVSGAAAFAAMWRAIPPLRPLGQLARNPAALWCLERLYRLFLIVRPSLQRAARRERKPQAGELRRRESSHGP